VADETNEGEERRNPLRGLLITQFFGAFNDNAWKMIVIAVGAGIAATAAGASVEDGDQRQELLDTTLAFLALQIPLGLFSLPAGVLCDRVSKRTVIIGAKVLELVLMLAATACLYFEPESYKLMLGVLMLMGVQSAVFSPAKYGILPEILPRARLSIGNAHLQLWTFVAIIAGTAVAGTLVQFGDWAVEGGAWIAPAILAVLALCGLLASRSVPHVPAARSDGGLVETVRASWQVIRADRVLRLSLFGMCFYWGIATLAGAVVIVFGKAEPLDLKENAGILLAVFGLGVGGGSMLAGKLSANKVEYGLIPLGACGLAFFLFVLGVLPATLIGSLVLMTFVGVSSGFLVVPLNALIQVRSPDDRRGAIIAFGNVLSVGGMITGNLVGLAMAYGLDLPAQGVLIGASLLTLAGTIWALRLLPDAFLRLVLILLTHTFYRVRTIGASNVPAKGGVLLVPNHVSFVDGLFLLASIDRPVRFLVDSSYFRHRIYGPFLRSLGAVELSSAGGPRVILKAMRNAGKFLDDGEVVCIFAEGQITRTGTMQSFQRGVERIVKGRTAPIIPVHLDRVWGSIFSREGGRFLTKMPKRIPYPVTVSFGEPLDPKTPVSEMRKRVHDLGTNAWSERKQDREPLHIAFLRSARRHPFRLMFADLLRKRVSTLQAVTGTIALAEKLRPRWVGQEHVGILLPPSVACALVNIASSLSGKTSVNLNYTVGHDGMSSAARQAELKTVVTSRRFLEQANIELPDGVEPIWIDEVAKSISGSEKAFAMLRALFVPARWIEKRFTGGRRVEIDDIITIIFSSGSTGEPKGILLSHLNVDANVDGVGQILRVDKHDRILGILPHFHSFGYMALWVSASFGVGSVFLPNPLDTVEVGEKVQQYSVTILIGTPTFLQIYLRRCTPAQFGSLRLVLAGAEKLTERVAQAFEDHFGIRPLEGYGTTECAPVIAASTLDYRAPGFYQPGSRRGSAGQALPGVTVKIVDPDDHSVERPAGEEGMLIIRGPNVMRGYLGRDDLTAEVIRDGWYITGDIAVVDEDGFIRITGRLSRFSKIGGEMVPHGKIEESLQQAAESDIQVFAVTAVPDEKKGERIAVLHTLDEERIPALVERLGEMGLPNLFIPRADQFVRVDELPILGTGKLDLRGIKTVALERLG
jgi:acyl-[acyl-carrier-protein]-phospholipid O-acyltransferase/long-chain-fatty-acid--[acyl-carrier-protein] ligase